RLRWFKSEKLPAAEDVSAASRDQISPRASAPPSVRCQEPHHCPFLQAPPSARCQEPHHCPCLQAPPSARCQEPHHSPSLQAPPSARSQARVITVRPGSRCWACLPDRMR